MKTLFMTLALASTVLALHGQKTISESELRKKWVLEKYRYFYLNFDPEEHELKDYMLFKFDHTFESVDEGNYGTGTWMLHKKEDKYAIRMQSENGEVNLFIKELKSDKLVVIVDHDELADVEIHFKAEGK